MSILISLIRQTDRQLKGKAEPCDHCGEFHVGNFAGFVYCKDKAHFAHGPEWNDPSEREMLSAQEEVALRSEIISRKNESYPGGYQQWCADKGIPEGKK